MKPLLVLFVFLIGMSASNAWASERPSLLTIDVDQLPRTSEKPESIKEFFKERTIFALGFDEVFDSNVFLKDNDAQEDYVTYLESQVAFIDPRGTIVYGLTHEINAFRYHIKNQNAIDHDFRAFFDIDPGGRYQFRSNYKLITANRLVLGPGSIDVIRRYSGFQRQVEHTWDAKLRYALNDTNGLVPQAEYSLLDDQAVFDADTDRKTLKAIIDLDHDLKPDWTLYGGYEFDDVILPARELKSSENHGARLGLRHELTKTTDLDLLLKFEHRRWRTDQQGNNLSFFGNWTRELGPRTTLALSYVDERIPSYAASRLQFRSVRPGLQLVYELTPLTIFKAGAGYEKQRSSGQDVLKESPATTVTSSRYSFKAGLDWQFREKAHMTLDYSFARSKTGDYTQHVWVFGAEAEF